MLNAVQKLRSPDNSRIQIVAIFPGPIRNHRDGIRIAPSSFFGPKSTTQDWFYSKCVEIISRDDPHRCAFCAIADAQCRAGDAIDDERVKQRRVSFEINEVGVRESVVSWYAARRADKREHSVLMWHERIRPDQNSFNPTQHRGI